MNTKIMLVSVAALLFFVASASAQNVEVTAYVGGQINGGYNFSTSLFHRLEVGNSVNYGIIAGYLLGEHGSVEFQWNRSSSDTRAQPIGPGPSVFLFSLTQNEYMGNYLLHFTDREAHLRPFLLFGLGASTLNPDVRGVGGSTRFTFSLGGGAKYNLSKHFGLRGQMKWSPTYLTTTNGGYWCDPFWGGCWAVGNSHYLHEFDITGGITARF